MEKKSFSAHRMIVVIFLIFCSIEIVTYKNIEASQKAEKSAPKLSPTGELLVGTWVLYNDRNYTLLIISDNGNWTSDIRVEDSKSKDIQRKGEAAGTWLNEEKNLIITVASSNIEDIWAKGKTYTFEIIEIDNKAMTLKYPNSRRFTWKKAGGDKESKGDAKKGEGEGEPKQGEGKGDAKKGEGDAKGEGAKKVEIISPVITMKPIVVNLNKTSSNDKDRYFCIALELHLQEMKSTAPVPKLHPRAWEAAILYLSYLLYNDVKTFDEMKAVTARLTKILNPYFDGLLKQVTPTHIMVSASMDKVEEFIIDHSQPPVLEIPEGKKGKGEKAAGEKKSEQKGDEKAKTGKAH